MRLCRDTRNELTARLKEQILNERGKHVPRFEVHEGANEVQAISRDKRDDDVTERGVRRDQAVGTRVSRVCAQTNRWAMTY